MKKLIRDKIPDIIIQSGREYVDYTAEGEELSQLVTNKILEEAQELCSAQSREEKIEELADLYEIMFKFAEVNGIDWGRVTMAAHDKNEAKGSFTLNKVLTIEDT